MLSVLHFASLRCCTHDTQPERSARNKCTYLTKFTPTIDIAIGIILCTLAALVSWGVPIPGAYLGFALAGSAELIIGVFVASRRCCKGVYNTLRGGGISGAINTIRTAKNQASSLGSL